MGIDGFDGLRRGHAVRQGRVPDVVGVPDLGQGDVGEGAAGVEDLLLGQVLGPADAGLLEEAEQVGLADAARLMMGSGMCGDSTRKIGR